MQYANTASLRCEPPEIARDDDAGTWKDPKNPYGRMAIGQTSDEFMTDLKLLSKATKAELESRQDGPSTRPAARPSGVASLRFAVAHTQLKRLERGADGGRCVRCV